MSEQNKVDWTEVQRALDRAEVDARAKGNASTEAFMSVGRSLIRLGQIVETLGTKINDLEQRVRKIERDGTKGLTT